MAGSGYETAPAEYADIKERLRDPAVPHCFRQARRLRREPTAVEALSFDGTEGPRDRFDPCDVVIRIGARGALASRPPQACEQGGRRCGRRLEHFIGPTPSMGPAVRAGEGGPGAWSVCKHETGLHRDAAIDETARGPAPPDSGEPVDPAASPRDPADRSIGRSRIRNGVDRVGVTPPPPGPGGWGRSADSPHTARDRALRIVQAPLLARERGPAEPACRFVRLDPVPVRTRDRWSGRTTGRQGAPDGPTCHRAPGRGDRSHAVRRFDRHFPGIGSQMAGRKRVGPQ